MSERLTRKFAGGYGLVKVRENEQEVDSPYRNTLESIMECFQQLGKIEDVLYDASGNEIISLARLRELADAEREGKIRIGRDWTPCAEGMPTKTADYKVTVQVGSEMGTWRETKIIPYRIVDGVGSWILPKSDWLIYGVIAWTKADEPWTGGLDGK